MAYDEDDGNPSSLLLCPPHPHLGSDMENNVIVKLGNTLAGKGFVSLRFNYRGVGNSESEHGNIADKYNYWERILNNDDYADALTDATSALEDAKKGVSNIPDPKRLEIFESCDHFYIDKEQEVANIVHKFLISV